MTGGEKFSLDEAIGTGWKSTKRYFFPLLGIMVVNIVVAAPLGGISFWLSKTAKTLEGFEQLVLVSLVSFALALLIELGMYNVQLRVLDELEVNPGDVFAVAGKLWKYLLASMLFGLACGIGFLCLIVPGVIIALMFQFYPYFIIEENLGPIAALKASHRITQHCKMDLFLFGIVMWFIDWLGALCLLIGKVPAYMVTTLSKASVYRQLVESESGEMKEVVSAESPAPV